MPLRAQDFYLPVNAITKLRMERGGIPTQKKVHYGIQPILRQDVNVSQVEGLGLDSTKYYYQILEKIFSSHLVELRKPGLVLNADPLFHFAFGKETISPGGELQNLYYNTRGFAVSGKIGEKVYFYTDFLENQAALPSYLDSTVEVLEIVPGSGRVKSFKTGDYDYNMASGFVGIRATDWLSLSFGHHKQFIGHGYRSLLLSNNAYNYPYADYTLRFFNGKLQHRFSVAILQNLQRLPLGEAPESIFKRKYLSFNYLSYKPLENLEFGFFESFLWTGFDDTTGTVKFDAAALNPFPGLNAGIIGLSNSDKKGLLGFNMGWQPFYWLKFYGQGVMSGKGHNNMGYQIGAKLFKIFRHIDMIAEYNTVGKSTYQSAVNLTSYTHYNQALSHPLGQDFKELLIQFNLSYKRWLARIELLEARVSNPSTTFIYPSEISVESRTGTLEYQDVSLAYIFNPSTNMQVYTGVTNRSKDVPLSQGKNQFWYIGFRTYLSDVYNDF